MQFKSALIAAALSCTVASNFVIVTVPRPDIDIFNIQSQAASLKSNLASRIGDLTASIGTSDLSRAASAQAALKSFVATAPSSLSIPAKVTELTAFETLTTTPAWFNQLPSDVKGYYESQNARVQSVVNDVAGARSTGVAGSGKVVGYMGAGAAAAMAGVFAL